MDKQDIKNWYRSNKRIIAWSLAACCVLLFYYFLTNFTQVENGISKITSVLSPFFFGIALAYALRPVYNLIARILKKVKFMRNIPKLVNFIAMVISYTFAAGIVALLCVAVIPPLTDSIVNLVNSLPEIGRNIVEFVETVAKENEMLQTTVNELYAKANTILATDIIPSVTEIVDVITESATSIFGILKTLFIGVIVSIYLLADKSRIKNTLVNGIRNNFSESASNAICAELRFVDQTFTRYITGTILDASIVGVTTYIFALITGIPEPILLAVTIAATNVIPIVGPFIGAIPTALIVLAYAPDKFLMYCIFLLILQQIDGHILVPKVLGSAVGISGLTALFAIVVGGGLFGIPGMILGVPTVTVLLDISKKLLAFRREMKQKQGNAATNEPETL